MPYRYSLLLVHRVSAVTRTWFIVIFPRGSFTALKRARLQRRRVRLLRLLFMRYRFLVFRVPTSKEPAMSWIDVRYLMIIFFELPLRNKRWTPNSCAPCTQLSPCLRPFVPCQKFKLSLEASSICEEFTGARFRAHVCGKLVRWPVQYMSLELEWTLVTGVWEAVVHETGLYIQTPYIILLQI
jgi:hypothetical protein